MIHLPLRVGLYVPSTVYERPIEPIEFIERITRVEKQFSVWFDGYTTINYARGGWLTNNGALIRDDVAIVYSGTDITTLRDKILLLFSYVSECFVSWEQHTISLELDSKIEIIEPNDILKALLDRYPELNPELNPLESIIVQENGYHDII